MKALLAVAPLALGPLVGVAAVVEVDPPVAVRLLAGLGARERGAPANHRGTAKSKAKGSKAKAKSKAAKSEKGGAKGEAKCQAKSHAKGQANGQA